MAAERNIALVAFARTSRHLAPFDDPSWEVWGLNEGYRFPWMRRWDRWFQLHPFWNFTREKNLNDPDHWKWLQNKPWTEEEIAKITPKHLEKFKYDPPPVVGGDRRRTNFPIYMQEAYPEVPGSVKYPLDEVVADIGIKYLTSTVAEMIALAILERPTRIGLWGIEMSTNTEWRYQRPGGEFMLGVALGKGIPIYLPEVCSMLRGKTYGWEALPMIGRQELEMYFMKLKKDEDGTLAQLNCSLGASQELSDILAKKPDDEEVKKRLTQLHKEIPRKQQMLNQIVGGRLILTDLIHRIDMQEEGDLMVKKGAVQMYLGGGVLDDLDKGERGDEGHRSEDIDPSFEGAIQ